MMQAARHLARIPKNPYRETRICTATLKHDLTTEESRVVPERFLEEACKFLETFSPRWVFGDPALRNFIAEEYPQEVSGERIALVSGAKYGLRIALEAIVDPGDEVLVPDPGYPVYARLVHLCRGVPKTYQLTRKNHFQISSDTFTALITPKTRAILLNSPALPMGTVLSRESLERVAEAAHRHNLVIVSDEVLRAVSETPAFSIATLPGMKERTIVVESISKRFSLSQWRIGWLVIPPQLLDPIWYILANGAPLATAAQAVLMVLLQHERGQDPWVRELRTELVEKRQKAFRVLSQTPLFSCVLPRAGNWLFPYINEPVDGTLLTERLAEKGVGVLPGSIFGPAGNQHIAISCAQEKGIFENNIAAMQKAVKS